MKKINSFWLVLLVTLFSSLSASALKLTFQWDIPGSVIIRTGSMSGDIVPLEPGATTYTVTTEGNTAIPYTYFFPAEGYVLTTMELPNGQKPTPSTNATYGQYWGRNYTSGFISSWGDDPVVKVGCKKLERNDVLTINVENGAKCIMAEFGGLNYKPELHDGLNTIHFDAAIESSLTLSWINGATDFYSLTLNGNPVTTKPTAFSTFCTLNNLKNGDEITIRVFENDEDVPGDVTLTVSLPEELADCIASIRNWSNSTFVELENNQLTVNKGTDLGINFKEDYTFTKFMLGDEDITSKYNESSRRLRFVLNSSATLQVTGSTTTYADVNFNAYVMNPEGVNLYLGQYQQNAADLSGGVAVDADIKLSGYTLSADATKQYSLPVSQKTPMIYIAPKDGWFIATVQAKEGAGFEIINNASADYTTFYVMALPMENNAAMNVNVTGGKRLRLSGNTALSSSWDNPEPQFQISEGDQRIDFNKDFSSPFSLRPMELFDNFEVYLDGYKLTADEESGAVSIAPYLGSDKTSTVTVYANGTSTGRIVTTNVTCEGTTATAFYGGALTYDIPLGKDTKYLRGTVTTVTPATADCVITLNGAVVHGMDEDGNMVNGLNEEGQYVFTPTTASADIVVKVSRITPISVNPESGATVKMLSSVKVVVPMLDSDNMMNTSAEALAAVTLTKKDGTPVVTSMELGEPGMNDDYTAYVFPILFGTPVTEAGEYILSIPEGTFFETAWDDAAEDFVKVENGLQSMAVTAEYTVDPSMVSPIENIVVSPAAGSALKSLGVVYVNFPDFGPYDMSLQQNPMASMASFSNGTKEITAEINQNWGTDPFRSFMVVVYNDNWEESPITEAGTWTFTIPAGAFTCDGEQSPAIEATYYIGAEYPAYPITPVPGKVTGDLSKVTITFFGAETSEYVDGKSVTLLGTDFESVTSYVSETVNSNEFEILFSTLPNAAGQYTLTIPAGTFKVNDMDCEEITAVFTFEPIWKLTPAPSSSVENLDVITLEFPSATSVEFTGEQYSFMLTNYGSYAAPGYNCEAVEDAAHPTFRLTMAGEGQQPPLGTLYFIVPEGTFVVDGNPCPEIKVSYVIEREISSSYEVDPQSRKIVYGSEGCYWTFIFDEASRVAAADYAQFGSHVTVTLDGTQLTSSDYFSQFENNMLLMGIVNLDILEPGELKVHIDAGAILLSGTPLGAIDETFTLVAPKDYTYVLDPAAGSTVESLAAITVSFPEAETAELFNEYGISLAKGYDWRATEISVTEVEGKECPTFKIEFADAPTAQDSYDFKCYSGTFTLDGCQASPEILATYTLSPDSGIFGIEASADGLYDVVTVDGCVVMTRVRIEKLSSLPRGLYIVNGRKVLVK